MRVWVVFEKIRLRISGCPGSGCMTAGRRAPRLPLEDVVRHPRKFGRDGRSDDPGSGFLFDRWKHL